MSAHAVTAARTLRSTMLVALPGIDACGVHAHHGEGRIVGTTADAPRRPEQPEGHPRF